MASLKDKIYLSSTGSIFHEEADNYVADFDAAIANAASGATEIAVLSGYCNTESLLALCCNVPPKPKSARRDCKVRIVIGVDNPSRHVELSERLRGLDRALKEEGFRNLEVGTIRFDGLHFHTKLYYFLRGGRRPLWFVGSANVGSRRHELMLGVGDGHEALTWYKDTVIAGMTLVGRPIPASVPKTLKDFFLTGLILYKPPPLALFTFDAFRLTPEQRRTLSDRISQGSNLLYTSPKAQGFGFSLEKALTVELGSDEEDEVSSEEKPGKVTYRHFCVETNYGLWIPTAYANELDDKLAAAVEQRKERLQGFADRLMSVGDSDLEEKLESYVANMKELFARNDLATRPKERYDELFSAFVRARREALAMPDTITKLSRVLVRTPMPDFWGDQNAADEFEGSFFAEVSDCLRVTTKQRRVVSALGDALNLPSGEMHTPAHIRARDSLNKARG